MRICILCENEKVTQIRKDMKNKNVLSIPLSQNGEYPATHWFCCMATNEEIAKKYLDSAKRAIIEISEPKEFLKKWNLKIIEL